MAQFDVFEFSGERWVVDVQSDLIDIFGTIVVVPLVAASEAVIPVPRLNPILSVRGERRILATHLLTVIRCPPPARRIASLADRDYEIKAALDMLVSGF